jgi:hypothetical protein
MATPIQRRLNTRQQTGDGRYVLHMNGAANGISKDHMANEVHVRAHKAAIKAAVARSLGVARNRGTIADAMMTRVGLTILGRIRTAFVVKARGGTDEAGESWKPLSPKTIAYSKTRQRGRGGRTRTEKGRPVRPSQALDNKQQARWWEVYRRQLAIYKGDKRHAAAVAWLVLKREGAKTLLDKYGHRQVEILRDTGLLLNSLSPGVMSNESVFRIGNGEIIVGTNRKGARGHHHGIPGRLPQRRLWPAPDKWPAPWWADIRDQVKQGMVDIILYSIKGT